MSFRGILAMLGGLLAAGLAIVFGERRKTSRARRERDAAQETAQAAEGAAIAERLAREQAETRARRGREREAIQDDLDDGLAQVETGLPGAVADALRDARGGGDRSGG